jgi:phosphate acyltransferase
MKFAVDAFGGDNAPKAVVEGSVDAIKTHQELFLKLFGKEEEIRELLAGYNTDMTRLEVVNAPEIIDCDESPTIAVKTKRNSSLVMALQACTVDCDGIISAGSTGALLFGATMIVKRLNGVKRPALAPLLPTRTGQVMLIDCGANVDCKPQYLAQFGIMGDAYMRCVMGLESPRIALLSNGTEEAKGNELTKDAHALLRQMPINFVGNIEARDILSGDIDVLVCDGFDGNIVLKHTEGAVSVMMDMLKEELMTDTRSKLGAALAKPAFRRFKKHLDYTEHGGAPLLGIKKCVIKAHGSSNSKAFCNAIGQAVNFVNGDVNSKIASSVAAIADYED